MGIPTYDEVMKAVGDAIRPLFAGSSTPVPPVVTPDPGSPLIVPGFKVKRIVVPWKSTVGTGVSTRSVGGFYRGEAVVFEVIPTVGYSSGGKNCSFSVSPTDDKSYVIRSMSISDVPGDFSRKLGRATVVFGQEIRLFFTVGERVIDSYNNPIDATANLIAGAKYYITVINRRSDGVETNAPGNSADVNYALKLPD